MSDERNGRPRIVAIETSGRVGSVALAVGAQVLVEQRFTRGMRHAVELLPVLRGLCAQVQWLPGDIEQVYVSIGPGSFTGLRIAVAVARSLALGTGCRVVGVPTLDVLAENAPKSLGNLVVMLDAKRGQVYAARYVARAAEGIAGEEWVRVAEAQLLMPEEFVREAVREGGGHVALLGEGLEYYAGVWGVEGAVAVDRALWPPAAGALHKLGWRKALRGEFTEADRLVPIYIRLAEAEEVWQRKQGENAKRETRNAK